MPDLLDIPGPEQHISDLASGVVANIRKEREMSTAVEPVKDAAVSAERIVRHEDAPMVAMIERIAMDPSIPIERLEQMLAMKERMEDRAREDEKWQARKAYNAAMAACQKELPVITRNRRNEHTRSNYADLAAIEDQAMPIIHSHGFSTSFQPAGYNDKGELQIKWKVAHNQGHEESDVAGIPVDGAGSQGRVNKTGTQAFGSTLTYGRRYLLCMIFNISTGDDRDGNNPPANDDDQCISQEQVKIILDLITETDSDIEKFCEIGKIEAVTEMRTSQFESAVRMLNQKKSKMAGRVVL